MKNKIYGMSEALRKTGLDILGEVPWGTHACLFFRAKSDLFDILVPYFKSGLEQNEFCLWIVSEPLNRGEAIEGIRNAIPDFDVYLEKGQIEVVGNDDWYLKEGKFDAQATFDRCLAKLNKALAKGYDGLRGAGCLFTGKEDWEKVFDYEKEIKEVISRIPVIGICIYPIDKCGTSRAIHLAVNHQFILSKENGKWEIIENSRLNRAEEELRKSKDQLSLVTDSLPVLISYIDLEHRYQSINKAYEIWYGLPRQKIYGRHIREVLGKPAYESIRSYIEAALSGEKIDYEAWVPYKRGGARYISAIYVPDFNGQGIVRGLFALVTDNTERRKSEEQLIRYREHLEELVQDRTNQLKTTNEQLQREIIEHKQSEEALLESEQRYRILFETSPDAILLMDLNLNILTVNHPALTLFGYDVPDEVIGRFALEFLPINDRCRALEGANELLESGKNRTSEYFIQKKDNSLVPVELRSSVIRDAEGKARFFIVVATDISERKASEEKIRVYQEQLRSLASELTLIGEQERRRIADDLHEHIGQILALSKIKLGEIRTSASPSVAKPLKEIHRLIEQAIQYTRSLTFELSPPVLYELGFEAAIEWLTEKIQEEHGIRVDFEDDLQPKPLTKEIRILLFKAVSELLMNVVKHAQSHKARVAIEKEGSNARITIEDDGIGFYLPEPNQLAGLKGFGLFSIRERLRQFGGSLQIQSGLHEGTLITLIAPIEQKEELARGVQH